MELKALLEEIELSKDKKKFKHAIIQKRYATLNPLEFKLFLKAANDKGHISMTEIAEIYDDNAAILEKISQIKQLNDEEELSWSPEVERLLRLWCLSYKDGTKVYEIFYDPETKKEIDIYTLSTFKLELSKHIWEKETLDSTYKRWLIDNHKTITKEYIRSEDRFFPTKLGYLKYNIYEYPSYRNYEPEEFEGDYELELFARYLNYLLPNREHRIHTLKWVASSLKYRQDLALCLIGRQGSGKTILTRIIAALHGRQNSRFTSDMGTKFNGAYLEFKTLVVFDEAKIDADKNESFKREMNETVAIQDKFIREVEIVNECSVILCANYHRNLYVNPNDRRFFLPECANKRLKLDSGFSNEELETIFKFKENKAFLHKLYNYLMDNFLVTKQLDEMITEGFETSAWLSAPIFYRKTLDFLRKKDKNGEYTNLKVSYAEVATEIKYLADKRLGKNLEIPMESTWLADIQDFWVNGKRQIVADYDSCSVYLKENKSKIESTIGTKREISL